MLHVLLRCPSMVSSPPAAGRLLVLGTSASEACGVRDYANVVARALREQGAHVELQWWEQDTRWSLRTAMEQHSKWLTRVATSVRASSPDWIIWHYSVFLWGASGIPYLVPRTARRLERMGVPILLVAHELAFPFGRDGWKGWIWAASQRVASSGLAQASVWLAIKGPMGMWNRNSACGLAAATVSPR